MKPFKQHIDEEWVTMNPWVGEMFVNPTSKELREYMLNLFPGFVAGIIADKKVYLFDGMHDDGVEEIRKYTKKPVSHRHIRFRALVKNNKMTELGPSGGDPIEYFGVADHTRETLFKDMAKVYTNRYLKPAMGSFKDAFAQVEYVFMKYDAEDHFEQLKQKYRLK